MKLEWKGDKVAKDIKTVAINGLLDGGEHILTKAIPNTPKLSGTLRRAGVVSIRDLPDPQEVYAKAESGQEYQSVGVPTHMDTEVYVSFNTPYARKQHEEMDYRHIDGGPKYLENAYNAEVDNVLTMVSNRILNYTRRG